jgi:Tat protein secretion system quality control protein TatD with DNase activity
MLNKVLVDLECMLLETDSKYKLTKDQCNNWIKYAVTKQFSPEMPWEDAEEKKKKKQGKNNGPSCIRSSGLPA